MRFPAWLGASLVALVIIGVGLFIFFRQEPVEPVLEPVPEAIVEREVIGTSVEGRNIESFTYGDGDNHVAFVGGIHGGYEWNSVLLAYQFIDYLDANPEFVPDNMTVTVIPSANPDAVYDVTGKEGRFTIANVSKDTKVLEAARFNANNVDLNRNFDCKWKPESTWRSASVSAGSKAFSEPEAKALYDFTKSKMPSAFVFWHSQANTVYASECEEGIIPFTLDMMNAYAKGAGYQTQEAFDAYEITGDAEGWLASIGTPAITVELKTHESIEWEKNLAGIKALLNLYQ